MVRASEMRELSSLHREKNVVLTSIEWAIRHAAQSGEFQTGYKDEKNIVREDIAHLVCNTLIENGYNVDVVFRRNCTVYTISWEYENLTEEEDEDLPY